MTKEGLNGTALMATVAFKDYTVYIHYVQFEKRCLLSVSYLLDQHVIPNVRGRHVPIVFEERRDPVAEGGEYLVCHGMTVIYLIL